MNKKYFIFPIFIFIVTSLTGCFDVSREIKFFPNGGGIENVRVTLGKDFLDAFNTFSTVDNSGLAKKYKTRLGDNGLMQQTLTEDIQKTSGTSLKEVTVTDKPDGSKEIYFQYTFDEPSALSRIIKEVTHPFSNQMNVTWSTTKFQQEGNNVRFKHVLRKAERSFTDSVALVSFSGLMGTKNMTYNIEMAFDVNSTNATGQTGRLLDWTIPMSQIFSEQAELTSEMTKPEDVDLPYADKIEKIDKIDKSKSPLIRVMVYNGNKEPVKVGTGIILKEGLLVTNFSLMNIMEGAGFFSIKLNNDSLAGIDDMKESDIDQNIDVVFMRFSNMEKSNPIKYGPLDVKYGQPIKILYYPNTLSPVVYSIDGSVTGTKKWKGDNKVIEIKPSKPLSLEGGAVYNEAGELIGMITTAFDGEVGKLYVVPAVYIKTRMK